MFFVQEQENTTQTACAYCNKIFCGTCSLKSVKKWYAGIVLPEYFKSYKRTQRQISR